MSAIVYVCPDCHGAGEHWINEEPDPAMTEDVPCRMCQATGEVTLAQIEEHDQWLIEEIPSYVPPVRTLHPIEEMEDQ